MKISRALLKDVHKAFGGGLRALLVGGAFTEPATIEFFHDLGIPIYNGYGCTEACTAITLNDQKPFARRPWASPFAEWKFASRIQDAEGIGEVAVRSKTVMSHYLDDPEMTAETIVDGWLLTGDLGRIDATRPFAALRPQEKHDRHRGRQEYLSRRILKRISRGSA